MFNFKNLNEATRARMLSEIDKDISEGNLYISTRLNSLGAQEYPILLKEAAQSGSEVSLANDFRRRKSFSETYTRNNPSGTVSICKMPITQPDTLAEGEFNRFYIRALCLEAIENGSSLEIYRAKDVTSARAESQAKIGEEINPQRLLEDLRANIGVDTALGCPPGPNSGLSVYLKVN